MGSDIDKSIDIMARTLWGEARGEGIDGMHAVANVIMNRFYHPTWWGKDIVGICQKKYQFSCWLPSDPNVSKILAVGDDDAQFRIAKGLSILACNGKLNDVTNGADSYKRRDAYASWAKFLTPVAQVGNHDFYIVRKLEKNTIG